MLQSLKQSVSEKLSSVLEKLSPSFQQERRAEVASKRPLKRSKDSKTFLKSEVELDMLLTPPEKRLKRIHEETGQPSSGIFSTFKDFKERGKDIKNTFLWRYVVEGKSKVSSEKPLYVDKPLGTMSSKEETCIKEAPSDILLLSPIHFKKTEEPKVKVHHHALQAITKRKPLHSQSNRDLQETYQRRTVVKQPPCFLTETSQIKPDKLRIAVPPDEPRITVPPTSVSTTMVKPYSTKLRADAGMESLYPKLNRNSRVQTADTVVRLEERERYRKLLAEYTSTPSFFNKSVLDGSYISRLEKKKDPITLEDDRFPRVKNFDSIMNKFSAAVGGDVTSNTLLSSTRISTSDMLVVQEAQPSVRHYQKIESVSSKDGHDKERMFSGSDMRNISRKVKQPTATDSFPLDNDWTSKWRAILSEEELDRKKKIAKEERKLKDLGTKRKEREDVLLKKIEARKDLDKKKVEPKLPALTDEMLRMVKKAWGPGNPSECLVDGFNIPITRHDLTTLADLNWLNDEVVNFYFNLLQERSKEPGKLKMHFFNSFFYPKLLRTGYSGVRRWTKKVDIFAMDIVVLPVHLGMHWCLAAIDIKRKQITYYDSLKGNNTQCVAALKNYIIEEYKDKKKSVLNIHEWSESMPKNIPEQLNGCDCGVFTCKYAECLTRDASLNFSQNNMPYFRKRMVYEILSKKLL